MCGEAYSTLAPSPSASFSPNPVGAFGPLRLRELVIIRGPLCELTIIRRNGDLFRPPQTVPSSDRAATSGLSPPTTLPDSSWRAKFTDRSGSD